MEESVQYAFKLNQPISEVAKSTSSYTRKSKEVVETALEFIAPGQSSELLTRITTPSTTKEPSPENKIVATLVLLYQGATSWYTKMTILSIFVKHYSKSS